MLTNTLVPAAASAQRAMPAGSMTVRQGPPKTRIKATAMAARSCASTTGFTPAAVIGNDVSGSPPWSPPV